MKSTTSRAAFVAAALMSFAAVLADGATPRTGSSALPGQADTAAAAALYAKHCATCHGNDGRAKTFKGKFKKTRDLTDAQWQAEVSDERLFNSITQGRGKMPSFKKKLSAAQIESLVAHARGLKK
ncbi:MAG: cytochrome c [Acidobacteria bacterium]|nr:cytochrome c [Acidobacteriota bacterium]